MSSEETYGVAGQPAPGEPITATRVSELPPQRLIIEQRPPRGRFISRVLLALLVLSVIVNFGLLAAYRSYFSTGDNIRERFHSLSRTATDKVAIIAVEGTMLNPDGAVKRQIDAVADDDSVKGVVLRVNSPGGTVTAADYQYHYLKQLLEERGMPVVVSMGGLAASGGYYISMVVGDTERSIFAEPSTWTGSIGVVIPHYDFSGLMKEWNVQEDSVKSHPLKQMGSPFSAMTEQERQILQSLVDDSFDRFKEIVRSGRPQLATDDELMNKVATGQVFSTQQAIELGLVDEQGFIEDAIERVIELAELDPDQTRVVHYETPPTLIDVLSGSQARAGALGLEQLIDLTVPRAFYIYSGLPTLHRNEK